ncbi:MAG: hypothetical protein K7J15_06470 [Candidatus Regiella insecticola]|nr:hypothetical protein [Candidatus Regiella insecticola]
MTKPSSSYWKSTQDTHPLSPSLSLSLSLSLSPKKLHNNSETPILSS